MLVGRIGRPHGLHGYVVVHPETDNPDRFAAGQTVFTDSGAELTVERSQDRGGSLLVRFLTVADRTAAEGLTGTALFIPADHRRPLDEGEFWPDDLIGLDVLSVSGTVLGQVESVVEGTAQYRLVVAGPRGIFEVPFVADLVPDVDLGSNRVVIADIPGLVPDS